MGLLCQVKFHLDGSLDRYKSCLMAQGYTQEYSIDYEETLAPLTKIDHHLDPPSCGFCLKLLTTSNGCKRCDNKV
jgi:hypothetical protein